MRGMHVDTNMTMAIHYMELAAQQDLPNAYNGLGVVYFHGQVTLGPQLNLVMLSVPLPTPVCVSWAGSPVALGGTCVC